MPFPRFLPKDATPGMFWALDETYGYGKHYDGGSNIERNLGRYRWSDGVWETLADINNWGTFTTPQIEHVLSCDIGKFVVIDDIGTALSYVYYSTSWNGPWAELLKLGWDGSAHNPDVSVLQGITYDSSRRCVYIGEYNTSSGTLAAGRYLIRLLKVDANFTVTQLCEWNRASTTQGGCTIRHIHGVRVDPYTNKVWVVTGDSATQSHYIEWDGSATWSNDAVGAAINAISGFRCANSTIIGDSTDSCRSIYPSFTSAYMYYARDGSSSVNGNFYRVRKSDFAREPLQSNVPQLNWSSYAYDGWSSLRLRDGRMLLVTVPSTTVSGGGTQADQRLARIYANSSEDSLEFLPVACVNIAAEATPFIDTLDYIPGTDRLILSFSRGTGMRQNASHPTPGNATVYNSVMFELDSIPYRGWRPDILCPVRWVSTRGVNSIYGGQTPRDPLGSLDYVLASNVTFGTRIMLSAGTHSVDATSLRWDTTIGVVGYTSDDVWVTGAGRDSTYIKYVGASAGTMFSNGFVSHNLILESLSETPSGVGSYVSYAGSGTVANGLYLIDALLGAADKTSNVVISPRSGFVRAMGAYIKHNPAASANTHNAIDTNSNTGGCEITLVGTVLDGGYSQVRCDQASVTLNLVNCGFTNAGVDEAVYFVTTGPTIARLLNCAFNGTADIKASAAPTAYDIGTCYAASASAALSGNARRLITSGASWVSAATGDFTPVAGSTTAEEGQGVRTQDFVQARWAQGFTAPFGWGGQPFKNPSTVGPVEYRTLSRGPLAAERAVLATQRTDLAAARSALTLPRGNG